MQSLEVNYAHIRIIYADNIQLKIRIFQINRLKELTIIFSKNT